ncbi:MAG: enoyl-CoA hydratase/isomerase family protein [Spongiibacteraceae bacterium]|nr:enoyl-CoA hydratase/isomerase family protein [Spongiibacteraceae bacterium]
MVTLLMNNPAKRNAYSSHMREALIAALTPLMDDPDCGAIVLGGNGGHFCAGGDIGQMKELDLLQKRTQLQQTHQVVRMLVTGNKPVVTAVEGYAMGAGVSLAAAGDHVVASPAAKFCASFMRVNFVGDLGLMWSLPQRVGLGKAKSMLALSEMVSGEEAKQIGLVDRLAEPGSVLTEAEAVAARFAETPPLAMALLKAALANRCSTLDDCLRTEVDYQALLSQTNDHKNAVAAFLEKKTPVFQGN